jgi:hypothetical protein
LVTAQVLKETLKQPPPIKIHPRVPAFSANRAFASASLIGRSWPLTADWPIGIKRRYQPSMAKDGALKIGATISPEMTRLDLQRQPEAGSIILETAVEHARLVSVFEAGNIRLHAASRGTRSGQLLFQGSYLPKQKRQRGRPFSKAC